MRWRKTATERRPVWPYIVEENSIKAGIRGKIIRNGESVNTWQANNWNPSHEKIINSNTRWDLFNEGAEWDKLNIELSASIDKFDKILEKVIPRDLISHSQKLSLTVLCHKTRYRIAENTEISEGKADISIDIYRKDVAGEIILSPSVILSDDVENSSTAQAKSKGARVATGFPVSILVDEPQDKPGGGIKIIWIPFPPKAKNALYQLELKAEEGYRPTLYINNEYPAIKTMIDSRKKDGEKAMIRGSLFGHIALDVWMQLTVFAAKNYEGECEGMEPREIMAAKILKTLSKKIKCTKNEIIENIKDEAGSRTLNLKIQNMLKIAKNESELIKTIQEEIVEE